MKAFLLHRDRDAGLEEALPPNADNLVEDLGLNALFTAMANDDPHVFEAAKARLIAGVRDVDAVRYRQDVLRDCLANSSVVRDIYDIATQAIEDERKNFWGLRSRHPSSILRRSTDVLKMFLGALRRLRAIADRYAAGFESEGFTRLFSMLVTELPDDYLAGVADHLRRVEFRGGILMSAGLGEGNRGAGYVLRDAPDRRRSWLERIFDPEPAGYTYHVHPRDESGARALSEIADRGVNLVAAALAQSADHILAFFITLRAETAFYVGCMNLHERLTSKGEPVCFPAPMEASAGIRHCVGLYDASLALVSEERVSGNDLCADGKALIVVTGANQGGKSTFLRSVGLSQLMMQSGMFVPAESYSASLCDGLFTHYKREEDVTMESGKFDEELRRMSDLVENVKPHSLLLFNESFAATNDREGSEIARQIVTGLVECGARVVFVTHLYEFASGLWEQHVVPMLFLRAQRHAGDSDRRFKLLEGKPLATSYGEDIYDRIFVARSPAAR
ncbi:MAG: MutS-related protein [Vulcanimicrobiaceae bacterium]